MHLSNEASQFGCIQGNFSLPTKSDWGIIKTSSATPEKTAHFDLAVTIHNRNPKPIHLSWHKMHTISRITPSSE